MGATLTVGHHPELLKGQNYPGMGSEVSTAREARVAGLLNGFVTLLCGIFPGWGSWHWGHSVPKLGVIVREGPPFLGWAKALYGASAS
jgi:hypothetical protein